MFEFCSQRSQCLDACNGVECSLIGSTEAQHCAQKRGHQQVHLLILPATALSFLTLCILTHQHILSLFTYLTIFCPRHPVSSYYFFPLLLLSPPPLPVVEVVSVMAVGRLPAAGEILINRLFICVERRAPAF